MKVLFDNLGFEDQSFGGVTRYFTEVIRHFPNDVRVILPAVETSNVYLQDEPFFIPAAHWSFQKFFPRTHFRGKHLSFKVVSRLISPFIEGCEIKNRNRFHELLDAGDFDILHLTAAHMYGRDWLPIMGKKPIVVTVHDLIPDKVQRLERFRQERKRIIPLVARFIAVSEHTKNDLVAEYGVRSDLIDVVYHGPSGLTKKNDATPSERGNYLLYVGGRRGYKNFNALVKMVAPWLRERTSMRLVCTGTPFQNQEKKLLSDLGILGQCEAQFFPTSALPRLYANAFAFVFPSLYEGFGIPILDAFEAGCPTVLSQTSCFPEIGDNAALYFDPDAPESLIRQLVRLEIDPNLRATLRERALERVKSFSWARAAQETALSYQKAIDSFVPLR